jgi:hypothetical protein
MRLRTTKRMHLRQRRGRAPQPGQIKQPPTAKKGPVNVIIQNRGEPGTRLQASPDPRRPHSPKAKVQGVCW